MDEPVKRPRGRPKKEEPVKRPVGRPKKEKPTEEEPPKPKNVGGRPKKAPEEKAVRKSRAKPKEPVEPEVGKILVRETAVTHPAGSGELLRPPPPAFVEPPRPAVVAKDPITGEVPVQKGIDITLPSPPSEVELPSDEEEARRVTEDYYARKRAQTERERIRMVQRKLRETERKAREEEEAVRTAEEKERETARQYETFRDSFRTPTAYANWEKRMLDEINKNYDPVSKYKSERKAFFLVLNDFGAPALAELSESRAIAIYNGGDWSKLKQSDKVVPNMGIRHIGYLGSGWFKNEEQYDRMEALRLRIFPSAKQ